MGGAEELSFHVPDSLRQRVPSDLELAVAMGAFETSPVEEDAIGRHPLHEVDPLVAEEAEVAGVRGGWLEAQGSGGLGAVQLRSGIGGGLCTYYGRRMFHMLKINYKLNYGQSGKPHTLLKHHESISTTEDFLSIQNIPFR